MKVRMLLVDDDEELLSMTETFLSNESDISVLTACSPEKALDLINRGNLDVIVCDYQMPAMTGLDILAKLRGEGCDIPFILLTAYSQEELAIKALNLGADFYMKKEGSLDTKMAEVAHIARSITAQKQALAESEARFTRLFRNLPVGFARHKMIFDKNGEPIDYIFLEINSAFEEFTGLKKEDVIGIPITQVLPTIRDDPTDWIGIYGEIIQKRVDKSFMSYSQALGKWYSVNAYSLGDNEFVTLFQDVTEQAEHDRQILKERNRAESILNIAGTMIVVLDENGIIQMVNPAGCEILGCDADYVVGKNWFTTFIPPGIRDEVSGIFTQLISGNIEDFECAENPILTSSGNIKPIAWRNSLIFDEDGIIKGIMSSGLDITHRKAIEKQYAWQALLVNCVNDAVISTDLEFNVLSWNKAATEMYGWKPEEVLGKPLHDFVQIIPDEGMYRHPLIDILLDAGLWTGSVLHKVKTGEFIPVLASVALIRNADGEPIGTVSTNQNMENIKQIEDQIIRQKEELSEFAHLLAHDLRSFILKLRGYIELSVQSTEGNHNEKMLVLLKQMDVLIENSIRLADSGLVIGTKQKVSLQNLIRDIFQQIIPPDVETELDMLPMVMCDPLKIDQVFRNLLDNAIQHGNPSSIVIHSKPVDDGIDVLVMNDGCKIDDELLPIILDHRVRSSSASGIGLKIVRRIVDAHGWNVSLDDTESTCFRIHIPARDIIDSSC